MKVSFLITYYNQAQYVKQSIESCLSQKYDGEIEILVADDGSSDDTCNIVRSYIEKYPNIIQLFVMPREQEKVYNSIKRVSAARLFLLEKATGEYYCSLDGDDWYCDDSFIQKGVDILEKDSSIAVCSFLFQNWFSNTHIEKSSWYKKARVVSAEEYIRTQYIHAGACIHRRKVDGEDFKFIKKVGIFDDNDILIHTLNSGDMYFIPEVVYSYRQTENSSWNSSSDLLRNLINVWTYEIESKYSKFKEAILYRYKNDIYSLYQSQNEVKNCLTDRNMIYFEYAQNEVTDYLQGVLFYEKLTDSEKQLFYREKIKPIYKLIKKEKKFFNRCRRYLSKKL